MIADSTPLSSDNRKPSGNFAGEAAVIDSPAQADRFGAVADTRPSGRPLAQPGRGGETSKRIASAIVGQLAMGRAIVGAAGNRSALYLGAKRLLDVVGALVLLSVLWPIMLATYVVLLFTARGRPIFRQERLGHRGRPFTLYKFRTMCPDAVGRQHEVSNEQDGPIFKNRRDPRITRFGHFLRSTSIDETPQLFNVLLGQMSLVGPRPPLAKEVAGYEPWQRVRLAVKPGLTCLWQVSGRSEIGFEEWVRMDLWYVEHQNLLTDLKLLVKTPWTVISQRGAY
jgi:lipopolysaccharide/colanic/teichoic acid biosynthesis glycosyltransferase